MFLSIFTTFIFSTKNRFCRFIYMKRQNRLSIYSKMSETEKYVKKVPVLSLHIVEATEPVLFFTYFSVSDISEYIDKFYFFNIRTGSVASYIWSDRTGWQYTQKGLKRKNMWKKVPVLSLHIVEATEPVLFFTLFLSILTNFYFSTSEPVLSLHTYDATEPVVNILQNV